MNTSKVNRVEVIDWTQDFEHGGGRAYSKTVREGRVVVELVLQDDDRTLKVFIKPNPEQSGLK